MWAGVRCTENGIDVGCHYHLNVHLFRCCRPKPLKAIFIILVCLLFFWPQKWRATTHERSSVTLKDYIFFHFFFCQQTNPYSEKQGNHLTFEISNIHQCNEPLTGLTGSSGEAWSFFLVVRFANALTSKNAIWNFFQCFTHHVILQFKNVCALEWRSTNGWPPVVSPPPFPVYLTFKSMWDV